MKYGEIKDGQNFGAQGNRWRKRHDGLGAELLDSFGCVSFIGGRRLIIAFPADEPVTL